MQLENALLVYLGIIILFFLIFLKIGIFPTASAVLTLIVGQILLNIVAPPYSLDPSQQTDSSSAIYILIQIATPIIAIIYLFFISFDERKRSYCPSKPVGIVENLNIKL